MIIESRNDRIDALEAEAEVSRRIAECLKPLVDQLAQEWRDVSEQSRKHVSGSFSLVRDLHSDYVRAAKNCARDAELIRNAKSADAMLKARGGRDE